MRSPWRRGSQLGRILIKYSASESLPGRNIINSPYVTISRKANCAKMLVPETDELSPGSDEIAVEQTRDKEK
jgi:hypothetical protein